MEAREFENPIEESYSSPHVMVGEEEIFDFPIQ
jgi:hypothetical protein